MIRRRLKGLVSALAPCLLAWLIATPVAAVQPDEILDDPALEDRARAISAEVRCLVCQNESIDSSNADLARQLRILIRERLTAGDSNDQVKAYLVDRYGDFVLFRPPLKPETYLLWFGPFMVFALALLGVVIYLRRQARTSKPAPIPLTADEKARLERIMAQGGPAPPPGPYSGGDGSP